MTTGHEPHGSLAVIDVPERCGNAPRKVVVRDFTISLVSKNLTEVAGSLADNARWTVNGQQVLNDIDEIQDWVSTQPEARELKVNTVITHGTECGVDGTVTLADGASIAFAHMLRFTGGAKTAKIKEIRSYIIFES